MARINDLSGDILDKYDDNGVLKSANDVILANLDDSHQCNVGTTEGCKCDKLLQEFHHFDTSLSIEGKWAGGSVTSVCGAQPRQENFLCYDLPALRKVSSNISPSVAKFVSLESIYDIATDALNNDPFDECVRNLVDQ